MFFVDMPLVLAVTALLSNGAVLIAVLTGVIRVTSLITELRVKVEMLMEGRELRKANYGD